MFPFQRASNRFTGSWHGARLRLARRNPILAKVAMTGGAADRSALVGRTGQEIPVTADLPVLLLIPRSSVLLQELGGALRNHHDDSANNESGQQVRKFASSPLRRDDSRHQDQRVGDPEPQGVFTVS